MIIWWKFLFFICLSDLLNAKEPDTTPLEVFSYTKHINEIIVWSVDNYLNVYSFIANKFDITSCEAWYNEDSGPPNDLIPCPPTYEQGQKDSRFEIDKSCQKPPCTFHPGADICIRSIEPSPSGAGQQCCYKNGRILLGPPGGGTVDKCHVSTYFGLCHLWEDVRTWALCCKESNKYCDKYYEKRPSDKGDGYNY